jgi:hypothetical protein
MGKQPPHHMHLGREGPSTPVLNLQPRRTKTGWNDIRPVRIEENDKPLTLTVKKSKNENAT